MKVSNVAAIVGGLVSIVSIIGLVKSNKKLRRELDSVKSDAKLVIQDITYKMLTMHGNACSDCLDNNEKDGELVAGAVAELFNTFVEHNRGELRNLGFVEGVYDMELDAPTVGMLD